MWARMTPPFARICSIHPRATFIPRESLQLGRYTKVAATTLQRTNMELWRTIAGIALAVLMFEWWYYNRRTV